MNMSKTKLTDSELCLLLEVARVSLQNKQMFEHLCEELDVAENEMDIFEAIIQKMCEEH